MKNISAFINLKKQKFLMGKGYNQPMVEGMYQQIKMAESMLPKQGVERYALLGVKAYLPATKLYMNTNLIKGFSGFMKAYNNNHVKMNQVLKNATAFNLASTKVLLGTSGLANSWCNLSKMAMGIQGLMSNNSILATNIGVNSKYATTIHRYHELYINLQNFTFSDRFSSLFKEIDWGSIEEFSQYDFDEEPKGENDTEHIKIELHGTSKMSTYVTVVKPKKKLSDLTVDEIERIINKAVMKAGVLSVGALIWTVFDEYIKDVAFIIIEIFLALLISFTLGSYNAEVKEKIQETIVESKTVRDAKKIITKYKDIPPVVGQQIAFLRTDTVLREGRSHNAPAIESVSEKTVLFIIDRKGNWLQVQVETENECYIGWVEESRVVKFKKMD